MRRTVSALASSAAAARTTRGVRAAAPGISSSLPSSSSSSASSSVSRALFRSLSTTPQPASNNVFSTNAAVVVAGGGALAVAAFTAAAADPAHADASAKSKFKAAALGSLSYDRAQRVMDWLADKGATFNAVVVCPVEVGRTAHVEEHGLGLYVKEPAPAPSDDDSGGGGDTPVLPPLSPLHSVGIVGFLSRLFGGGVPPPVVVASVPLRLAVTVAAAADHPALGTTFREMLAEGDLDERLAVMLLLIVERRRGDASPLKPYLDALPSAFHTPLFYTPEEMEGLRGTNLHAAVTQQRRQLCAVLERHVQPAAKRLFTALKNVPPPPMEEGAGDGREKKGRKGASGSWFGFFGRGGGGKERVKVGAVTMEEFQWAYAIFWSRALSLPVGPDPASSVVEGIVPGVDFANHSGKTPNARWAIAGLADKVVPLVFFPRVLCVPD